jgi:serine/threonine protein phosphatase PrpC
LHTAGEEWFELFEPPQPDAGLIEVATASLPAQEPEVECVSLDLRPDEVVVLVTDGVADPWRDGPESVAPALAAGLSGRPSPLELAALADFSRQGCHDDRTVAVLWIDG